MLKNHILQTLSLCAAVLCASAFPQEAGRPLENVSVVADSILDLDAGEQFHVRFWQSGTSVVQIVYNDEAQPLMEAELDAIFDYGELEPQGKPLVFHFVLLPSYHEEYSIGRGRNQAQIWERPFYAHFNYLEHSGIDLAVHLAEDWGDEYAVQITGDDKSRTFSIERSSDKACPAYVRAFYASSQPECAQRLEYFRDGTLTKVVRNNDFREVAGVKFPFHIEVSNLEDAPREELHLIREVQINAPLPGGLFDVPQRHAKARVFRHQLVRGTEEVVEQVSAEWREQLQRGTTSPSVAPAP